MATTSHRLTTGLTTSITSFQSHSAIRPQSISLTPRNHINRRLHSITPTSRRWIIKAVQPARSWDGSDDRIDSEIETPGVCAYAIGDNEVEGSSDHVFDGDHAKTVEIVIWAAATAALGVGNRVMYKLALVPLKHYPFFLAQLSTFGYVAVYYCILYFRYRAGTVTDEMLSVPKTPFLIVGILEALAAAAGMAAAAFQAICIALLLPFLSKLWGIPFNQLGSYLKDGAVCFLNIGTMTKGCDGAPLLPLLFVIVNIGYNIALLRLLKISSAVVSCLASTLSVPIAVFLFTLPLPYLGVASPLPKGFMAGTMILVLGMVLYSWTPQGPNQSLTDTVIPSPPPT